MNLWKTMLSLALVAAAVAGCSGETTSSAAASAATPAPGSAGVYTSPVLQAGYADALPASSQLALGTLELEGTENAVTPDQAKELLPLWQAVQSGALKSGAETNAAYSQIERALSDRQLAAIAAMQLTAADVQSYIQERGLPAAMPSGQGVSGGQAPAGGPGGNLTDEQRSAMRATAEAGGMPAGGPGGGNPEQFAAMRATAEAGGTSFPGRPDSMSGTGGRGPGSEMPLTASLIQLLTQRADE